jgi:hypothetical protein
MVAGQLEGEKKDNRLSKCMICVDYSGVVCTMMQHIAFVFW